MKSIGIITFVSIAMLLSGCVDQPVSKVDGDQPQQKQEAPKQTFKVGDVVKVGDTELVIQSATLENGDPFLKPKKGKVLELEIEGTNKGSQSWFLTDMDFNLYDKSGQKLEHYFAGDVQPLSGEINQGKKVSGKILFDVPKEDSYELIYKHNFLSDQEIKFDIKPK